MDNRHASFAHTLTLSFNQRSNKKVSQTICLLLFPVLISVCSSCFAKFSDMYCNRPIFLIHHSSLIAVSELMSQRLCNSYLFIYYICQTVVDATQMGKAKTRLLIRKVIFTPAFYSIRHGSYVTVHHKTYNTVAMPCYCSSSIKVNRNMNFFNFSRSNVLTTFASFREFF